MPWLLEGDRDGEAVLARWRAANERVRADAGGDEDARARLWFELVENRGPGTFDEMPEAFREMWLKNFTHPRPPASPPSPLGCGDLARIAVPTLVLETRGGLEYSRVIAKRVARCVPGSRLERLRDATHFVSYERPDLFNAAVLAFIEGR